MEDFTTESFLRAMIELTDERIRLYNYDKTYTGTITKVLFTASTATTDTNYERYEVITDGGFFQPQILDGIIHNVGEPVKVHISTTGKTTAYVFNEDITSINIADFNDDNVATVDFTYGYGDSQTITNAVCRIEKDEENNLATITFADGYGRDIVVDINYS